MIVFSSRSLLLVLAIVAGPLVAQGCEARDFIEMGIDADATHSDWQTAILLGYPRASVRHATGAPDILHYDGRAVALRDATDRSAREVLASATVGDQFRDVYPLGRDLVSRLTPFQDPGRARNADFFAVLYGPDRAAVEDHLITVDAGPAGQARFRVTRRHGVACQLSAAISEIEDHWDELARFFAEVGGGYNWRSIAGTRRLSAHSYGIAVDINAALGGYWRWSGAIEGDVGNYDNKVPWRLVEIMERHGFIWGGKWHHFDGMHFEYRPELILYSRLVGGDTQ